MTNARRRAPRGSGEALRGQILAAARTLLAETGDAEAVSIRAVAEAVGVTPPSIYLHFADKGALLTAVVADLFTQLGNRMDDVDRTAGPMEQLCQQGMAYIAFALESPEHYRLATMSRQHGLGPIDEVLRTSAFATFAETVQACMSDGIFRTGDPVPVALQLWAAAHGIASLLITKPDLPWGDKTEFANHALGAAAVGLAVVERMAEPTPTAATTWLHAWDEQARKED